MIKFNVPFVTGKELLYIQQAIENQHMSSNGYFSECCEDLIRRKLGAKKVLLTSSCTHALEMTALLLNIQPGDEFIAPSFTFVSTINSFLLRGARPVFVDIKPDTLNIDENLIERLITKKTKAVIPVHYAGIGCEMEKIISIANHHRISVVEDNAHGFLGKYKEQFLGTFGSLSTISFHDTKNIHSGEGGALIINDPKYFERADLIHDKGTNKKAFLNKKIEKYTWVDIGSSYGISEILAAFLFAQLEAAEDIQERRKNIWKYYMIHLMDWANFNNIKLPTIPSLCVPSYHLFYVIMPTHYHQQKFIQHLKDNNITSCIHYVPLHNSSMARKISINKDCPITEKISQRIVRLPFHNLLSVIDQERVVHVIKKFQL